MLQRKEYKEPYLADQVVLNTRAAKKRDLIDLVDEILLLKPSAISLTLKGIMDEAHSRGYVKHRIIKLSVVNAENPDLRLAVSLRYKGKAKRDRGYALVLKEGEDYHLYLPQDFKNRW